MKEFDFEKVIIKALITNDKVKQKFYLSLKKNGLASILMQRILFVR